MKKKTAIPILLCAVCLVTLLRCQKTESDKSTETVNDSSSQNRLAEEAVLPEDSQNDTPSGDSYEEFEGSGYIADGCYFEFIDMTVEDADRENRFSTSRIELQTQERYHLFRTICSQYKSGRQKLKSIE